MSQIHSLVSEGEGTQDQPFVVVAPGYVLAIHTEREIVEAICGASYDEILLRREYPDNTDLCATVVRHKGGERTIWFDLRAAREGVESRKHLFDTPEGRAAKAKMVDVMADLIAQQNQQRGRGCILVLLLGVGAAVGTSYIVYFLTSS
jgi:hypothetical protein